MKSAQETLPPKDTCLMLLIFSLTHSFVLQKKSVRKDSKKIPQKVCVSVTKMDEKETTKELEIQLGLLSAGERERTNFWPLL